MNGIATIHQRPALVRADTHGMPRELDEVVSGIEAALWYGELMIATGRQVDPFPDELDDLAAVYFELFPPRAKA